MGAIGMLYKLLSSLFFGASMALLYPLGLRFISDAESHFSGATEMGLEALKENWSVAIIVAHSCLFAKPSRKCFSSLWRCLL